MLPNITLNGRQDMWLTGYVACSCCDSYNTKYVGTVWELACESVHFTLYYQNMGSGSLPLHS